MPHMPANVAKRRVAQNRALAVGISASVLVHAVVLTTFGPFDLVLPVDADEAVRRAQPDRTVTAIEVVNLSEPAPIAETEPAAGAPPAPAEAPSTPAVDVAAAVRAAMEARPVHRAMRPADPGRVVSTEALAAPAAMEAKEFERAAVGEDDEDEGGGISGWFDGLGGLLEGIKVNVKGGGKDCGPLIPVIEGGPLKPGGSIGVGGGMISPGGMIRPHAAPFGPLGTSSNGTACGAR